MGKHPVPDCGELGVKSFGVDLAHVLGSDKFDDLVIVWLLASKGVFVKLSHFVEKTVVFYSVFGVENWFKNCSH